MKRTCLASELVVRRWFWSVDTRRPTTYARLKYSLYLGTQPCLQHLQTIESLLRSCRQHRHDPLVNNIIGRYKIVAVQMCFGSVGVDCNGRGLNTYDLIRFLLYIR